MNASYVCAVRLSSPVDDGSYLKNLPIVRQLACVKELTFTHPVTFLVGENGTGKSTLLEAIAVACGFNAEGGTRNFNFSTARTHSDLYRHLTISKRAYPKDGFFLRAESFYNVASNIDEMDDSPSLGRPVIDSYGGVSLHKQSHGESFTGLAATGCTCWTSLRPRCRL